MNYGNGRNQFVRSHDTNISPQTTPYRFTAKEMDVESGLYSMDHRYLDPKVGMWLSVDPAMGEYIPGAPVNDEVRKKNQNLPGMGGVFNYVNANRSV
jgi:RHS repeat-associated protein